ncbi:MAG: hemerythrin family protein [Desulfovibrionaceae bacterium]
MQTYQWSEALSVGVPEIDEQHKVLVSLLAEVQTNLLDKMSDTDILNVLRRLQKYADVHFQLEEGLMRPIKDTFPSYHQHLTEHHAFSDKVQNLIVHFVQEGHTVAWQLFIFLGDWFMHHIQQTDVTLGEHLCAAARP